MSQDLQSATDERIGQETLRTEGNPLAPSFHRKKLFIARRGPSCWWSWLLYWCFSLPAFIVGVAAICVHAAYWSKLKGDLPAPYFFPSEEEIFVQGLLFGALLFGIVMSLGGLVGRCLLDLLFLRDMAETFGYWFILVQRCGRDWVFWASLGWTITVFVAGFVFYIYGWHHSSCSGL
jgi:hypothetical protein